MPPRPIDIDFTDAEFASYFDEEYVWSLRFGLDLLDRLPLRPDQRILDIGCGTGFPFLTLASMAGPSCRLVGLDVWQAALERAEQKRRYFDLDWALLTQTDGLTYPFADSSFDLLVCNLGVNNFDDPDAAVAEWGRVVKPSGRVALTTNLVGHMREFYDLFMLLVEATGSAGALQRLAANIAHRGTPAEHLQRLERAGFTIDTAVEGQFTLRYLNGSALFTHPLVRMGFLPGWLGVVDEADRAPLFAELEQELNAYAETHGGLNLTVPTLFLSATR